MQTMKFFTKIARKEINNKEIYSLPLPLGKSPRQNSESNSNENFMSQ